MKIGKYIKQSSGFKAFIPEKFPPVNGFDLTDEILQKANEAILLTGKLNGISSYVPDIDFFLMMYFRKDAATSSQIEGTKATMLDAILTEAGITSGIPDDVDDILHYIEALKYAFNRLETLPMSLPFIREVHKVLMQNARTTHFSDPGVFRKSQNWIGGTKPENAAFVPPPPFEMMNSLNELEKFIHRKTSMPTLLKIGLIHAQFETIHPFLDGNGRIGRILISLLLHTYELIDKPVLLLSSFFKKHQNLYYKNLSHYHNGDIQKWLSFFLEGIIETSEESIGIINKISDLVKTDNEKISKLSKNASLTAKLILENLYSLPIVDITKVMKWTGFTRPGAQKIVDKLIKLEILHVKDKNAVYGRVYVYKNYLKIFE